jgi:hypothetical protein
VQKTKKLKTYHRTAKLFNSSGGIRKYCKKERIVENVKRKNYCGMREKLTSKNNEK